jgi:hypothetical protein
MFHLPDVTDVVVSVMKLPFLYKTEDFNVTGLSS